MRTQNIVIGGAGAVIALLVAAAPAQAADGLAVTADTVSSADMVSSADTAAMAATAATAAPSATLAASSSTTSNDTLAAALTTGCWGKTDQPHLSNAFASVHAQTGCPFVAPMIVSTNLLRLRWYGWEQEANGYASGTRSSVDGNAKWYCSGAGTCTYQGSSYHRATVGGRAAIGYTANQGRFGC